MIAVGRVPNSAGIGLDNAGIETDGHGYIRVNDRLQTTAPDVWAIGECAGSPHFTHVAFDDFRVVRDNLNGGSRTTNKRLIPFCMFTDPELARVGLNESEARKLAIPYRVAKIPMAAVLRTRTLSEMRGFLKALISAENDEILGFTAIGNEAGELMSVVQTAMLELHKAELVDAGRRGEADKAGIEHFTPHDLRRTAATGMAGLGVAPHVVDRILNHASGTISGVARIYNRHEYLAERQAALLMWARHIEMLVEPSNVARQPVPAEQNMAAH